jgi:predicted nucleotidyltransferase
MREQILKQLDLIERENGVTIVFAIESGSRAWGFPSTDSDYDVRFVYARKPEWYLSIAPGRDVIEIPVDPILDINGWDVRKALQLLRKSNISLMEWLSSPIQYRCNEEMEAIFRSVVPHGFQQHTSARHYLSMAKTNIAKTHRDNVRTKSYLYAIRPLLCCKWVLERNTQPPMKFRDLVGEYLAPTPVGNAVSNLIDKKETQTETETIPKNDLLDQFISTEFDNLAAMCPDACELPDVTVFDDAFRRIIAKA